MGTEGTEGRRCRGRPGGNGRRGNKARNWLQGGAGLRVNGRERKRSGEKGIERRANRKSGEGRWPWDRGLAKDEKEVATAACFIYVGPTSNFLTPPAALAARRRRGLGRETLESRRASDQVSLSLSSLS